jgi:hypothetical protein
MPVALYLRAISSAPAEVRARVSPGSTSSGSLLATSGLTGCPRTSGIFSLRRIHEEVKVHRDADVAILKQADAGVPIKDICRQASISSATYYQWKSTYGGMEASDLKRVKELEAENSKLKRM